MKLLILNSGSSSLKYTLFEMIDERVLMSGTIDRIGLQDSCHLFEVNDHPPVNKNLSVNSHGEALDDIFRVIRDSGPLYSLEEIRVIGHRVAHGGRFKDPLEISPELISEVKRMTPFFPLHHPTMALEIEECIVRVPHAIHVAVFDMTFHQTIPDVAAIYGLPYRYFAEKGYRRTGYHGHSHQYVSIQAARFLERDLSNLKLISCHLGNGSSVTAIEGGKSVDTTMGMTAVEGLIMGTRSGDIDPGLIPIIMNEESLTPNDVNDMLYKKSGLLGISGISRDMREITEAALNSNERSRLALDAFCYKCKRAIGSMLMIMGGCDALIFTGGIGLNSAVVRSKTLEGTNGLGFSIDSDLNDGYSGHNINDVVDISAENSRVKILVIRTFEELMMARQCLDVAKKTGRIIE